MIDPNEWLDEVGELMDMTLSLLVFTVLCIVAIAATAAWCWMP